MLNTILITGSSGFLGSRIAEFYSAEYNVLTPSHKEMDITDEQSVSLFMRKFRPDAVVHCAAVSDVGLCEKEPDKSWKVNVNGSINIAKAAADIHAKCILCSSDQVYFGSDLKHAHKEDEVLFPYNLYGKEKLTAEKECLKVNPDCVLLRLSWMYDTKSRSAGEHGDFFRTMLSKLQNHEILSYPVYDRRGITDVNEVIRNLERTFELPGGVYNFGAPNDSSTFDTVFQVFADSGLETDCLQANEEAFKTNPRNITMSQEKINSFGLYFGTTEEGILTRLTKWLRS